MVQEYDHPTAGRVKGCATRDRHHADTATIIATRANHYPGWASQSSFPRPRSNSEKRLPYSVALRRPSSHNHSRYCSYSEVHTPLPTHTLQVRTRTESSEIRFDFRHDPPRGHTDTL